MNRPQPGELGTLLPRWAERYGTVAALTPARRPVARSGLNRRAPIPLVAYGKAVPVGEGASHDH